MGIASIQCIFKVAVSILVTLFSVTMAVAFDAMLPKYLDLRGIERNFRDHMPQRPEFKMSDIIRYSHDIYTLDTIISDYRYDIKLICYELDSAERRAKEYYRNGEISKGIFEEVIGEILIHRSECHPDYRKYSRYWHLMSKVVDLRHREHEHFRLIEIRCSRRNICRES